MGAKLAAPDRRVIAVVGDGGFAHVWSELETAVRENLPVIVLVLNNSILAAQRHAENAVFGETTKGVEFGAVDHASIAAAVGATGIVVEHPDNIETALHEALESSGTVVIDVIVDPDAYPPVRAWDACVDRINTQLHRDRPVSAPR
jgi:acetolactate synthase-1/2/3 large subunit